jgi:two-component system, chemotaxis family, sensor kinase CheA
MSYETLINLLNEMASDFMFLDGAQIDVPAAGKFMNHLDKIAGKAAEANVGYVREVTTGLNILLEKIIFDTLQDKGAGMSALGEGISLLQSIVDGYTNSGRYDGNIHNFADKISFLTGIPGVKTEDANGFSASSDSVETAAVQTEGAAGEEKKSIENATIPVAEENQMQDESLLRDFIAEGLEYIEEIEVNILNLEKNPEDKDYINAIFRPFHSIKGVASFLNLDQIRDLAHNLENLLDKARNGELEIKPPVIDVVLDGADALKALIGQVRDKLEGKVGEPFNLDISSLVERIKNVEKGGGEPYRTKKLGEILLENGNITQDTLEEGLKIAENNPEKKLGETLISEGKVTTRQVSQALRKQAEQVTDTSSIRVDTRKLDDLIDMVGELVINQSMVQMDLKKQVNADRNLTRDMAQLFRITSGLQGISTSMRMVPIKQTFQRMSRLVRDLAKNSGKVVNVELLGEETEIDRNMVDDIYNPLVHMVRNSVDHGLEMPEDRIKAGKPEGGLIRLRAYHRGGRVVIEISDDGKGLDREKILGKAIKNGIIVTGEGLSEQDIYRMIFLPGLSTAEKVTDVSGRGVGMDVVKRAVEKLRGKIEIDSVPGKGTTFSAGFPLTMAIIDGMIVKVGSQYYILPTTAIRQALRPRKEDYNNVVGKGEMISVMGKLLPLVRMYSLFGIIPECETPWDAIVLVVEGEKRSKCLLVDKIIGKTEVVIKSLGEGLGKIKGVSGGAILGDGRIGLILDTEGIFELSETVVQ